MKIWLINLILIAAVFPGCQQKKERGSSGAISAQEQCYQRGTTYRWENNMCINGMDAQSECYSRTGYTWQNGMCVLDNGSGALNCQNQGGIWQNGQCLPSNTSYASCRQQPSFQGILSCIQQSTQTFRNLLNSQSQSVNNLSDAVKDIDTFSEKSTTLLSSGLTSDMTGLKKVTACWHTTSMINQLRQMSKKLEFSDNNLRIQSQSFIDGMHGASREMQDRINCPLKF